MAQQEKLLNPERLSVNEWYVVFGVVQAAHEISHFQSQAIHTQELKSGDRTIVTQGDKKAQNILVPLLSELYPDEFIQAEEDNFLKKGKQGHWYIDPIDGTTNYANQYKEYAITVGRYKTGSDDSDSAQSPDFAVTALPGVNEIYVSKYGIGTYSFEISNGTLVPKTWAKVSEKDGYLQGGLGLIDEEVGLHNGPSLLALIASLYSLPRTQNLGIRSLGSNLYNQMMVASGRAEWGITQAIGGLQDILPGAVAVLSSGGKVTLIRNQSTNNITAMLYSNGQNHDQLHEVINQSLNDYLGWHGSNTQIPELQTQFQLT